MSDRQKTLLVIFGAWLVIFSLVIVFRDNGLLDLKKMKNQLEESEKINDSLKIKNSELYNEVERLKRDADYIENVARNELGMIREDEIVIKFHPDN